MSSAAFTCPRCTAVIEVRGGLLDGPNAVGFALQQLIRTHVEAGACK